MTGTNKSKCYSSGHKRMTEKDKNKCYSSGHTRMTGVGGAAMKKKCYLSGHMRMGGKQNMTVTRPYSR